MAIKVVAVRSTEKGDVPVQSGAKNYAARVKDFVGGNEATEIRMRRSNCGYGLSFFRRHDGTWYIWPWTEGIARSADDIIAAFHARM